MKPTVFNHQQYTDLEADYMILKAENEQLKARLAVDALREKQERQKGCVWCNENSKVFHDGQHFHFFCSYCGKRLEVEHG